MSGNVKQTEKVSMDPKYIATLTVRLFGTCMVVAFLLGLVNMVTLPNITARQKAATDAALKQVVENPDASEFSDALELSGDMTAAASGAGATLSALYAVTEDDAPAGYALTIVASGSQGNIEMMVGVDEADVVTGVSIVSNSETPGIGSKVMGNEPTASGTPVLDQFIGKSPADGTLSVGGGIDAIGGATVSTRGVTTGVNAALAVAALMD